MPLKPFIQAARLRTLPLAAAGSISGNILAYSEKKIFNPEIFLLSTLTAILLQVLSNYANDYGDFKKGTDGPERSDRVLASGGLHERTMKQAILALVALTLLCGTWLLLRSFQYPGKAFWILLVTGIAGIAAAYFYTAGKKSYGYVGLGDMAVFLFFGPVAVQGCYFLQTGSISGNLWWVGMASGLLSTAVLNVNNLRDMESDKLSGKRTIAVRLGRRGTLRYQLFLLYAPVFMLSVYGVLNGSRTTILVLNYLLFTFVFGRHYLALEKCFTRSDFNRQLKILSLLVLTVLLYFCLSGIFLKTI